ncbi:Gmad2 immunoglobulin-like domain-containing protein [Desulfolucanica intricata]|uniref:Gmad2 immunoglobulin-like domain-containing protein n=1 Tax=Desulfolucanica intricata TaxID=1285191 RepID=UPI000833F53D|nr:Gmad2 immunoglobulin-like domain-containing protein [Desulfolucanica intricata]
MRRNVLLVFLLTIFLFSISGCTAAKKPQDNPPSPTKILVPQVSTIPFDTVEVKKTPKVVQDVAKDIAGKDAATWLKVNNRAYILVSQSSQTASYQVEIAEVLQKIPDENYIWTQVTLTYKPSAGQENAFDNDPLVAVFDLPADRDLSGVGFDIEKIRSIPGNEQYTEERPSPHRSAEELTDFEDPVSLEITTLKPEQDVTSPIKVSGKIKNIKDNNQLIIRLRDNANQIIVEKPAAVTGNNEDSSFDTTISYPTPQNPEKASVEVLLFNPDTGVENNVVKIPVTLK